MDFCCSDIYGFFSSFCNIRVYSLLYTSLFSAHDIRKGSIVSSLCINSVLYVQRSMFSSLYINIFLIYTQRFSDQTQLTTQY